MADISTVYASATIDPITFDCIEYNILDVWCAKACSRRAASFYKSHTPQ
jgi:hypothetical protein